MKNFVSQNRTFVVISVIALVIILSVLAYLFLPRETSDQNESRQQSVDRGIETEVQIDESEGETSIERMEEDQRDQNVVYDANWETFRNDECGLSMMVRSRDADQRKDVNLGWYMGWTAIVDQNPGPSISLPVNYTNSIKYLYLGFSTEQRSEIVGTGANTGRGVEMFCKENTLNLSQGQYINEIRSFYANLNAEMMAEGNNSGIELIEGEMGEIAGNTVRLLKNKVTNSPALGDYETDYVYYVATENYLYKIEFRMSGMESDEIDSFVEMMKNSLRFDI